MFILHEALNEDGNLLDGTTELFNGFGNLQGVHSEEPTSGTLHLHLRPLEMKRVGVVFTPADYGKVTSLILIR